MVFTLPAPIAAVAWYSKAVVYGLLFDIAAETMRTIAGKHRATTIHPAVSSLEACTTPARLAERLYCILDKGQASYNPKHKQTSNCSLHGVEMSGDQR